MASLPQQFLFADNLLYEQTFTWGNKVLLAQTMYDMCKRPLLEFHLLLRRDIQQIS